MFCLSGHSRYESKDVKKALLILAKPETVGVEGSRGEKRGAQIVLCAFDKEKLLRASLLAKPPGGGGGHYKVVERLEVSDALATYYHCERTDAGSDETR